MRISDWSSDVCSSDLRGPAAARRRHRDFSAPVPRPGGAAAVRRQLRRHRLRRAAGGILRELPMTRRPALFIVACASLAVVWSGLAAPLAAGPFSAHMVAHVTVVALAAPDRKSTRLNSSH